MKKSIKLAILGAAVVIACVMGFFALTMPVIVPLTEIYAETAELSFSEQGTLEAEGVVQVMPLTQGSLLSLKVGEGQYVAEGDVLCVVDSEPLKLKLSQIQSGIEGYKAQIDNLDSEQQKLYVELRVNKNSLLGELAALNAQEESSSASVEENVRLQKILIKQSLTSIDRANAELERAEFLYEDGSISKQELEQAQDVVKDCENALEANKQQLSIIEAGGGTGGTAYYNGMKASLNAQIEGINQSLNSNYTKAMTDYYESLIQADEANIAQLEKDIANCEVRAPTAGVVTALYAKDTNYISGTSPVAEITDTAGALIQTYVSTKDADSISEGDTVELTLKRRGGDLVFPGDVTHIDPTAELKMSALGVEERRVKVRITPRLEQNESTALGVGYDVDVKFIIYKEENAFAVPKTALYKADGKDMLWVVRNGKAQALEVETGMELRTDTVIKSGLKEGDSVVTDANNKALKNGLRVKNEQ